jgi:hypothetical protein
MGPIEFHARGVGRAVRHSYGWRMVQEGARSRGRIPTRHDGARNPYRYWFVLEPYAECVGNDAVALSNTRLDPVEA